MARFSAVASPTSRIPKANRKRGRVVLRALSMAATRLRADFCPIRSRPASWMALRLNKSAGVFTSPLSTSCSTILSPRPSTSMARRAAKCLIASLRCASQNRPPEQRVTASPSSRSTAEPHTGHWVGKRISRASTGRCASTTATICGITSPARRTITVSPIMTPRRAISSALCRVALETVTPPTNTGLSLATGVTAPVRPTWNSTFSSRVISSSAGNLWAVAQRGARATKPSSCCSAMSSTL
ncbi:hypothetical protein D3C81_1359580 [compost metagenome]